VYNGVTSFCVELFSLLRSMCDLFELFYDVDKIYVPVMPLKVVVDLVDEVLLSAG
jgi:hypothetical protein